MVKQKILLIDDDLIINLLHKRVVQEFWTGFEVLDFQEPRKALVYLETLSSVERHNLVLFLDINMPDLDGWEFLALLEKDVHDLQPRVFMLSSSVSTIDLQKAKDNELVTAYISKPLTSLKLHRLSHLLLGELV